MPFATAKIVNHNVLDDLFFINFNTYTRIHRTIERYTIYEGQMVFSRVIDAHLAVAILNGNVAAAEAALSAGADLYSIEFKILHSASFFAAIQDNPEIIDFLFRNNVDLTREPRFPVPGYGITVTALTSTNINTALATYRQGISYSAARIAIVA
jgi:hypothetical protein